MHTPDLLEAERCACGCDACGASIPAGLDLARARDTELGRYRVQLVDVPAHVHDAVALSLSVDCLQGAPAVTHIAISGGRPRCRCAAPPDLAIARRGPGQFETTPFAFPSSGWWVLRVTVSGDAGRDAVTFNVAVG